MAGVLNFANLGIKCVALVLNIVILILYRIGGSTSTSFLGISGSWTTVDELPQTPEILASGVILGFMTYNVIVLVSYIFGELEKDKTLMEVLMLFIGMFLFFVVGGIALGYWLSVYNDPDPYPTYVQDGAVAGIWLGILLLVEGLLYLADLALTSYLGLKYLFEG